MKLFSVVLSALASAEVAKLTDSNFKDLTKIGSDDQEKKWFVKFYAPWCPHCKHMAPEWEAMSKSVTDDILVGEVDATAEQVLSQKFNITGFPRMYLFDTDGMVYKYPGARTAEAFVEFANGGYKSYEPVTTTKK